MWAGALYPGLGEQRRRPCLRLQQAGVTAFHPASSDAGYVSVALSMRPSREDRPRLAPGTLLYAVWTFLSDPALRDQSGRPSSRRAEYTTYHLSLQRRPMDTDDHARASHLLTLAAATETVAAAGSH